MKVGIWWQLCGLHSKCRGSVQAWKVAATRQERLPAAEADELECWHCAPLPLSHDLAFLKKVIF